MRILVIEDEFSLADIISSKLKKENYIVDIQNNGEDGLYSALSNVYDLILLDVMLPKVNGFEILKKVKQNNISSKIIMLTAKSSIDDKLEGFQDGADDYITKPFHMEELVARVNVQLRKNDEKINKDILEFADLKLNLRTTILTCINTSLTVEIVCKEFLILEYLMNNPNQVISKYILYDKVWGLENDSISNNLEAYISFIRKKIKAIGSKVNIKAIRGLGYRIEVSNEEVKK